MVKEMTRRKRVRVGKIGEREERKKERKGYEKREARS
jgi:hypothetical protein